MRMYAEINDAELYYEVLGSENRSTIVILHGGPGISDHAKGKQAYESLANDHEVVVYDHRGCGQSSLTPPYSNEQYAKDLDGLCDHLDIDEMVLVGGSYGGFITQEYATRFPDRLVGIVLRDTSPSHEYETNSWQNARESWDDMKDADLDVPDITWEDFSHVMEGNVASDEEFERVWLGMLPLYAPTLADFDAGAARESVDELHFHHQTHNEMFTNAYPNMDYTPELPNVDTPALVTVGRHDWITPPEAATEIADLLPDSRLVVYESSGHSPNLDQRDAFLARVDEFFEEIGFGGAA